MILLYPDDFVGDREVLLLGRRARHVREVHRAEPGRALRVGRVGGKMGSGVVLDRAGEGVAMEVTLTEEPPPPLPVTLLLAMPRPKCFRRVIQGAVTMGVKRIALFGAYRVEKSYWNTPWLAPDPLREQIDLGLEQARDTVPPVVSLHPLFKPFIEDHLAALCDGGQRWVAHPGSLQPVSLALSGPAALAIGPEGGFTEYEFDLLKGCGFAPVSLGPRILRTEQVVPALLSRFL